MLFNKQDTPFCFIPACEGGRILYMLFNKQDEFCICFSINKTRHSASSQRAREDEFRQGSSRQPWPAAPQLYTHTSSDKVHLVSPGLLPHSSTPGDMLFNKHTCVNLSVPKSPRSRQYHADVRGSCRARGYAFQ